jgi:transcriptional regulator with XRE-family HTH domain
MPIGDHIRALRWDRHLKQGELARRAGIAQNTLSQIELGKTTPSVPTLEKIARGLNLDLSELLLEEPVTLAEASEAGLDEVARPDYPYPWMGDTLARTIDRWAEAVRGPGKAQPDPKYSHIIVVSCMDVLWSVLRHDVPGDTLRDRVPEEEEYNQRARVAQWLWKLVERAQEHYVDSRTAEPAEVQSFEERREEIKRRSRELSA